MRAINFIVFFMVCFMMGETGCFTALLIVLRIVRVKRVEPGGEPPEQPSKRKVWAEGTITRQEFNRIMPYSYALTALWALFVFVIGKWWHL